MNLYLRWLRLLAAMPFRQACDPMGPSRLRFRVVPTDLDVFAHVTNSKYLAFMDLGRTDLLLRSGLARHLWEAGWYPVVAAETIQFRRPLHLFERFTLATRILGWDERAFFLEQRFEREGAAVALAAVRVQFLRRAGGRVTPDDLLVRLGRPAASSPPLPDWVARWSDGQQALRRTPEGA